MPILIYTGMYLAKTGLCAFTSGMRFFGYEEMEIVDSPKQPNDLLGFLLSISEYVLSEGVELKDSEPLWRRTAEGCTCQSSCAEPGDPAG